MRYLTTTTAAVLVLALSQALTGTSGGLESVLSRCCQLGSDWGRQQSYATCADFPAPSTAVPGEHLAVCIAAADICCRRDNRSIQCRRGSNAALTDKSCAVNTTELGEAYKDCCEACKLGMISGSLGESCRLQRFSFGLPWDDAYHECCARPASRSATSNDLAPDVHDGGQDGGQDGGNQTLCEALKGQLCAHVCVPTPGSFRCECHPGFALMPDGKSCQLISEPGRCSQNNPCMHICRDTGLAIECSCRPGYELQSDRKSCKDIDECQRGTHLCRSNTQVCRNDPGGYTCLGSDGAIMVPPLDPSALENELGGGGKDCPLGYQFNPQSRVCDDLDECALGASDCPLPKDCVNTIGSYRCDGAPPGHQGACPPGYIWDDVSQRCADKDECEEGSDDCDDDSEFCLNSQGGYACLERTQGRGSCPAGYKKDPTHRSGCQDVNECLEQIHDCHPDEEVCRNTAGAYECDPRVDPARDLQRRPCDHGFRFNANLQDCEDVDECVELAGACRPGQRCVNAPGSFVCVSNQAGTKADTPGPGRGPGRGPGQRGACPQGFKAGASAGLCDDVDECADGSHTCSTSEECVNEVGRFRCESRPGPGPARPPAPLSRSTSCPHGYEFDHQLRQCVDVDECADESHTCSPSERCVNEEGAFQCSPACEPGFRVRPPTSSATAAATLCVDIDECAEGLHSCLIASQRCHNTNGSFVCEDSPPCPPGYFRTSSGGCDDVDECAAGSPCRPGDLCINAPGSYRCNPPRPSSTATSTLPAAVPTVITCAAGFRYRQDVKRCLDVNECSDPKLHICDNRTEFCINEPGGYRCVRTDITPSNATSTSTSATTTPTTATTTPRPSGRCMPGFTYSFHSAKCVDQDECLDNPCDSNQRCHNSVGSYSCECREGFARDPVTQACVDINECQLGLATCLATQRCDNTIGSFQCIRYSGCGTGYTLNAATGNCEDDDECELHTDNCRESGPTWVCRNTQGSFRCERKQCESGHVLLPSGECRAVQCDPGFSPAPGTAECADVDECAQGVACGPGRRCVNVPGSYKCVYRIQCRTGFVPNDVGDRCVDEDECALGTHKCKPGQACLNRPGSYQCQCPAGHELDADKNCVDVDECKRFPRQVCSDLATCENTVGSYRCICKEGYRQGRGKSCEDIDECTETAGLCQQQCVNVWGSYRCTCERGFYLHSDNRSCIDVDECQVHKGRHLCVGECLNTPGSYKCSCPPGYRLGKDGRLCHDIDECATGRECRGPGEVCLNMQGSFRCNNIRCPDGYQQDLTQKNRCRRVSRPCPADDAECRREPLQVTFNFMALVSNMSLPPSGQLDLFVLRGPANPDTHNSFSLALDGARAPAGIIPATRNYFRLTQVRGNQAVVSLLRPLPGPQDIELNLSMEVYSGDYFAGLNVAKLFLFVSQYEF